MPLVTILIVDDDSTVRDIMKAILEQEGFSVLSAANGLEGIQCLDESHEVGIVLLEMMMPEMNGWEFLDHMKADARLAKVPVVIVSAYHEIARSILPASFVPKPVRREDLLAAIDNALTKPRPSF